MDLGGWQRRAMFRVHGGRSSLSGRLDGGPRHLRDGLVESVDVAHNGQARELRERGAYVPKEDVRRGSGRSRRGVGSDELRELGDGVKKQDEVLKRLS